jgi:hypothetical protein
MKCNSKILVVLISLTLFISAGCVTPPALPPSSIPSPPWPPMVDPPTIECPKQPDLTDDNYKSSGKQQILPIIPPITTDISMTTLPRLGETAELTCRFTAHVVEWPTEVKMYFSNGISFEGGYRS